MWQNGCVNPSVLIEGEFDRMTEMTNGTEPKVLAGAEAKKQTVDVVRTVDASAYAPIVGEHHFGKFDILRRRKPVRPWVASVFVRVGGQLAVFARDKQPTIGELLWGGYRALFEVDLSLRRLGLEITLPSSGDAFMFRAEVDLQWRVTNPCLVVGAGISDIRKVVMPPLLDGLRQATRTMQASDVEVAEKAANAYFDDNRLTDECGLWTKVLVRLRMDEQKENNVRLASEVQAFKMIIECGDIDQFALQLAQNPAQIEQVVQLLVQERDAHRREVCDFITRLLESDALDRWQIDDHVRVVLQWLNVSINRVLTGTDGARPFPFLAESQSIGPDSDV
jgi:hypothetical protein